MGMKKAPCLREAGALEGLQLVGGEAELFVDLGHHLEGHFAGALGVGLHDLNRSAYGGDIYMYNGSHGCINLPVDFAKQLFDVVSVGIPVLIIP